MADRVDPALDAVAIDEDDDPAQVVCEHERLVAGGARIQQKRLAVGNHTRHEQGFVFCQLVEKAEQEGARNALVAAAEDGHAASSLLERAGEHFDHRGFSGATNGQVPHADHQTSVRVAAKNAAAVEGQPGLHDEAINRGKPGEQPAQDVGAPPVAPFENDVDGKGFEAFDPASHGRMRTPELSAPTSNTAAPGSPEADSMARAIFSVRRVVMQAIVEPEPLSHPPMAPADSAAAITAGRQGSSFSR